MKYGIPCNETHFTNGKSRNHISYRFVSNDLNTPATCTISLGDIDPITGESITDMDFFREYYREVDHEIHQNIKAMRPSYTKEHITWREKEKQAFILDFQQKYGYTPSADDILYHMEQVEPERYHLYWEEIRGHDNDLIDGFGKEFIHIDEDPFGTNLSDDLYELREIANSLTGRLKAVYEAMLQKAANVADRITYKEIARIWGVSYNQIMKDTKKIEKMIRERIKQQSP